MLGMHESPLSGPHRGYQRVVSSNVGQQDRGDLLVNDHASGDLITQAGQLIDRSHLELFDSEVPARGQPLAVRFDKPPTLTQAYIAHQASDHVRVAGACSPPEHPQEPRTQGPSSRFGCDLDQAGSVSRRLIYDFAQRCLLEGGIGSIGNSGWVRMP